MNREKWISGNQLAEPKPTESHVDVVRVVLEIGRRSRRADKVDGHGCPLRRARATNGYRQRIPTAPRVYQNIDMTAAGPREPGQE